MTNYIKFIIPLLAIVFASCSSTQRYAGNDRDDRYGNVLSDRGRYEDRAYRTDWYDIDQVKIAARNDQKSIRFSRSEGRDVREILFRTDGPVDISRVSVKYSNGRTEELNIRNTRYDRRRNNNSSLNDDIILPLRDYGRARVREVTFWYDVDNRSIFSKRPTVSLYARK